MTIDWDTEARRIVGKPILECSWDEKRRIESALEIAETDTNQDNGSNA